MSQAYLPIPVDATATPKMRENVSMSTTGPTSLTNLLLLGKGSDLASERGVSCTGELPAASDPDLVARAITARAALGSRALVLGHHYQRDEVIEFADITGDSFKLAQAAAAQYSAE
jgi:quinolinate synthase